MRDKAIVTGDKKRGYKVSVNFIQVGCTYKSEESAKKYAAIYNREEV